MQNGSIPLLYSFIVSFLRIEEFTLYNEKGFPLLNALSISIPKGN